MKLLNNINVFGRENEITTIKSKLLSNKSEFIAIYGNFLFLLLIIIIFLKFKTLFIQ